MREIKFRAWDGLRMTTSGIMFNTTNGSLEIPTSYSLNIDEIPEEKRMVLMQYTGLKDKNGKEIYEGDIVTAKSEGYEGKFEIKWRQSGSPCWILYPAWQNREIWHISATEHKKGMQFISVDCKVTTTDKDGFYDDGLEVIGNIYENPELINKEKGI